MKKVSPSKLVVGQQYSVNGEMLTFVGTRFSLGKNMDPTPVSFGRALFGDRWIFVNSKGKEVVLKKGFSRDNKPGLVPVDAFTEVEQLVKIVA